MWGFVVVPVKREDWVESGGIGGAAFAGDEFGFPVVVPNGGNGFAVDFWSQLLGRRHSLDKDEFCNRDHGFRAAGLHATR